MKYCSKGNPILINFQKISEDMSAKYGTGQLSCVIIKETRYNYVRLIHNAISLCITKPVLFQMISYDGNLMNLYNEQFQGSGEIMLPLKRR